MTRLPRPGPTTIRTAPAVAFAVVALMTLAACGSDGPAGELPPRASAGDAAAEGAEGEQVPVTEPVAVTEPVVAEPTQPAVAPVEPVATPAPAATTPDRDVTVITTEDDDTDWMWIALLIGLGVVVLGVIVYLIGRRKPDAAPPPTTPSAAVSSPQSDLLDTSQWIHDQFSIQLMAAPPQAALERWATERSRLDGVAIGAQQLYLEGGGEMWQSLGQIMSVLGTSIETNLQLRAQVPPNVELIAESANVVNQHRATLQQAIDVLRTTIGPPTQGHG